VISNSNFVFLNYEFPVTYLTGTCHWSV